MGQQGANISVRIVTKFCTKYSELYEFSTVCADRAVFGSSENFCNFAKKKYKIRVFALCIVVSALKSLETQEQEKC